MALERLQKILARAGVASRRGAERLIAEGRVSVDGKRVSELGVKADARRQRVLLDGRLLEPEPLLYVLFHKPRQVMCTLRDPEGRPTVLDFVKKVAGRVVPVGRLDYHTSGVLLLTNDGEFAAAMMHPRHKVEKVYVAKVNEPFGADELQQWTRSIMIDGKPTQPAKVRKLRTEAGKVWIEITLHEGKNRQIHRIGEAAGSPVLRLARVSFAGIGHEGLRPGQWRYLSKDELTQLKKSFGVPRKIWPAPPLPEAERVRRVRASGERKNGRTVVQERPRGRERKRTKSAAQAWEPRSKPARAPAAKPERAKKAPSKRGAAR